MLVFRADQSPRGADSLCRLPVPRPMGGTLGAVQGVSERMCRRDLLGTAVGTQRAHMSMPARSVSAHAGRARAHTITHRALEQATPAAAACRRGSLAPKKLCAPERSAATCAPVPTACCQASVPHRGGTCSFATTPTPGVGRGPVVPAV